MVQGYAGRTGIAVEEQEEWNNPEVVRFARIHDPDGATRSPPAPAS